MTPSPREASWQEAMTKAAIRQEATTTFPDPANKFIVVLHFSDSRTIQLQARETGMYMMPSGNINMAVSRLCEILDCFIKAHATWFKENPPPP
jgi:hypothetical protein